MNFSHFLARRFTFTHSTKKKTPLIIRIATGGISLGVFIIFLSISITLGYKEAIYEKLMGFNKHISLTNYATDEFRSTPIAIKDDNLIYDNVANIQHKSPYASIGAIAVSKNETEALLLKGVTHSYNWNFFKENLVSGTCPHISKDKKSNEILISETLSKVLQIKLGNKLHVHFLQSPPRTRVFKVVGIFNTNISELDKLYAIVDARHIQKIHNWSKEMYSGIEITLTDADKLNLTTQALRNNATKGMNTEEDLLKVTNTKERYSHIFDWLNVMGVNVRIILTLIIIISSFNMISALLVIIIEKTRHIGVLKALGMHNKQLRKVFLYKAFYIIGKGLLWGNIAALAFAIIQQKFHWLTLNPDTYYLKYVPIKIDFAIWAMVNLLVIIITLLIMLIPTSYIARISPTKAIKIE